WQQRLAGVAALRTVLGARNDKQEMFDFLFEGSLFIYLLLGLAAAFLLSQWNQSSRRATHIALGVVALLALLYFALDQLVKTDKAKALQLLDEVTALVNKSDYDKAFSHFADDFRAYDMARKAMRDAAERALKNYNVRNIRLKSISVEKEDRD